MLETYWDIGPHQFYAKGDDDRFVFEPLRDLVENETRIKMDLTKLEPSR